MRRTLILLASIGLCANVCHGQRPQITRIAYLRYTAGLGGDCSVSVVGKSGISDQAPSEGGSYVHFTVFKINSRLLTASTVFDELLEGAPDVINAPDVLLVQHGKRFPEGQATWLPTSTDVYRWTGEKYELSSRWKWGVGMRFQDRFCVLAAKSLSCPATEVPLQ